MIGLSGRGDKDVDTVAARAAGRGQQPRVSRLGDDVRAPARAGAPARLVPYFMAGRSEPRGDARAWWRRRRSGRRHHRDRAALLRSPGRRPHDPAGRRPRARRRGQPLRLLPVLAELPRRGGGPPRAHELPQPASPLRPGGGRPGPRARRASAGLIVPDLPIEESGPLAAGSRAAGLDLIAARRADQRARPAPADRAGRARASSTWSPLTGITGERREPPARPRSPWCATSGR